MHIQRTGAGGRSAECRPTTLTLPRTLRLIRREKEAPRVSVPLKPVSGRRISGSSAGISRLSGAPTNSRDHT